MDIVSGSARESLVGVRLGNKFRGPARAAVAGPGQGHQHRPGRRCRPLGGLEPAGRDWQCLKPQYPDGDRAAAHRDKSCLGCDGERERARCEGLEQAGQRCVSICHSHSDAPRPDRDTRTSKTTSAASRPPIEWPTSTTSVVGDSWGASQLLKLSRATSMDLYVLYRG